MTACIVTLQAKQPLLFAMLQGDPNSRTSFPYIPGSVIRGALIAEYRRIKLKGSDLNLADRQTQRLFFDSSTRYLHGYPLAAAGTQQQRSLPTPRSLVQFKVPDAERKGHIYDISTIDHLPANTNPAVQGLSGFVTVSGNTLQTVEPERQINVHNQRDRVRGRSVEGSGALFRYDAVARDTVFQAVVLCDEAGDAALLAELLQPGTTLWLGGSRSAGYGETTITAFSQQQKWAEVAGEGRTVDATFRLTLLSDLFARGEHGQPTSAPPLALIGRALGIDGLKLVAAQSALGETLHGGFNRSWGLPMPQAPALAAGSVLTLTAEKAPSAEKIRELEWLGLGERRAEGFGRVAIEWPPRYKHWQRAVPGEDVNLPAAPALSDESGRIARMLARRLLNARIEARITELVSTNSITGNISNAQLSRLRIVARRAMAETAANRLPTVRAFLESLPSDAKEQYRRARIGTERLDSWLLDKLNDPSEVWGIQSAQLAGETVELTADLASRATLQLIMSICRLRTKEVRS